MQAGLDEPLRNDTSALGLPPGIRVTPVSDRTLNEMLLAQEIAAVITGFEPAPFVAGDPRVVRLFTDFEAVERAYFRATKVFPIMHLMVVRATLLERDPWIAENLYAAFVEARRRSVVRTLDAVASRFPMPWTSCHAQTVARDLGDPFPYGVQANRPTLETFIRDAHEQGVVTRRMPIEEIFVPQLRG